MLKKLAIGILLSFSASAWASEFPTVTLHIENTSPDLTDLDAYGEMIQVLSTRPEFKNTIIDLCVEEVCGQLDLTPYRITPMVETLGDKTTVEMQRQSSWAKDVGDIVGGAVGKVSGSAKLKVGVNHTETKTDGTSTSTTVNVEISVSGSKGK